MRAILKTLFALLALLVVLWLGLWFYAELRLQQGLQAWVAQMQSNPTLKVSFDSVSRGSSPLAARVTLNNLQITAQPGPASPAAVIIAPAVALRIDVLNPLVMHLVLPPQITVNTQKVDLLVTIGSSDLQQRLDLQALQAHQNYPFTGEQGSISNINILASSGSLLVLHIDGITLQGSFNRAAGAGDTAIAGTEDWTGISLSPVLTRVASIPFGGKIDQLGLTFNVSGPNIAAWQAAILQMNTLPVGDALDRRKLFLQTAHDWAAAGGSANGSFTLAIGPSALTATGNVKFDSNAQPSGTASVTADHLDAFAAAIINAYPQTQDSINNAQARLSPYLTSTAAGGQTLNVQVTYGKGAVQLNGQTFPLPPINWTLLENSPPTAPGDGSGAAMP